VSEMTTAEADALRKPFPKSAIGKLPKAGMDLDYVGHAAVTDRLLSVDPAWTWEPMATDEHGNPHPDIAGNLWIRLTVHGVTRIGVGDGPTMKIRIGDAIRNAAMRFGVALDLWSKEELERGEHMEAVAPPPPEDPWQNPPPRGSPLLDTRSGLAIAMYAAIGKAGIPEEERSEQVGLIIGRTSESTKQMTEDEARKVLDHLKAQGAQS
jgi:hypothetical protein